MTRSLAPIDWPNPLLLLRALLAGDAASAQAVSQRLGAEGWCSFRDLAIERHRVAPMVARALDRLELTPPSDIADEMHVHGYDLVDTAGTGGKTATLETGAVVRVPLFINEGETLKLDTRTGEYVSRVKE